MELYSEKSLHEIVNTHLLMDVKENILSSYTGKKENKRIYTHYICHFFSNHDILSLFLLEKL